MLLIACANVANLLLARSAARQNEFGAIRGLPWARVRSAALSRQLVFEKPASGHGSGDAGGVATRPVVSGRPLVSRAAYWSAGAARRPPERPCVPFCRPGLPGFRPDFRTSARVSVGAAQRNECDEARRKARRYTERAIATAHLRAPGGGRSGPGVCGSRDARIVCSEAFTVWRTLRPVSITAT